MTFPSVGGLVALDGLNRNRQEVHNVGDYIRFFLFVKSDIEANVDYLAVLHIVFLAFQS